MIERLGKWLAGPVVGVPPVPESDGTSDLDERVEAIVGRVDGLEARVDQLELNKQKVKPPREKQR